ncbi:hypothetical protein RB195_020287 [Necator americanus]|uniref:Uncharacterized protein n=1 Tax=Necator americanus TaxID=51031 RepID=A0ABR1CJM1_NECAM
MRSTWKSFEDYERAFDLHNNQCGSEDVSIQCSYILIGCAGDSSLFIRHFLANETRISLSYPLAEKRVSHCVLRIVLGESFKIPEGRAFERLHVTILYPINGVGDLLI